MPLYQKFWPLEDAQRRSESQFADWAVNAIKWYVATGRASRSFETALWKANPDKLIKFMLGPDGHGTDEELLMRCKSYLHRYCGYRA